MSKKIFNNIYLMTFVRRKYYKKCAIKNAKRCLLALSYRTTFLKVTFNNTSLRLFSLLSPLFFLKKCSNFNSVSSRAFNSGSSRKRFLIFFPLTHSTFSSTIKGDAFSNMHFLKEALYIYFLILIMLSLKGILFFYLRIPLCSQFSAAFSVGIFIGSNHILWLFKSKKYVKGF